MATMALPDSSGSSGEPNNKQQDPRLSVPSHNPLPLSASQEAQVRDVYYARVRQHCAEEIKAFAACARSRTFSIPFACRAQNQAMNACMLRHATPSEQDAAREEWFSKRLERQREREHKARRAREQESFMREWWNLPEDERRDAERLRDMEEKLGRAERVAGVRRRGEDKGGGKEGGS
ncbi:hypothetical protein MKZ38_007851 [Zalerion maritima]|uniref:COX assembly mitochondrial protein n=1 Tax=Zalerion maritima TaxID=339359 RepID=A0AAD5WVC8_9PEZI|nr:hypothetical protein MKZ38_007851 [Zalerion maritima]